jgi:hypothetical protein
MGAVLHQVFCCPGSGKMQTPGEAVTEKIRIAWSPCDVANNVPSKEAATWATKIADENRRRTAHTPRLATASGLKGQVLGRVGPQWCSGHRAGAGRFVL